MSYQILDALKREVDAGTVFVQEHGPYKLYKYARSTFIDSEWNETNRKCRGIVFNETKIVCKPFEKFFNIGEHPETNETRIRRLIHSEHYTITSKIDGSLICLWFDEGQWHTSTTGSLISSQSKLAMEIIKSKYNLQGFPSNITYLFELLTRSDEHVIDYGPEDKLIFLTAFENTWNVKEVPITRLYSFLDREKIEIVKPYACDDLFGKIPDGQEGFVLAFHDGFRVKFKSDWYFKCHKLLGMCTPHNVLDLIANNLYKDQTGWLPPNLKEKMDAIKQHILEIKLQIMSEVNEVWSQVKDPTNFKECALLFKEKAKPEVCSILFCRMKSKDEDKTLIKAISIRIDNEH